MADRNAHLVERVAARLRGTAGLAPPDPAAAPHAAQVVPLTVTPAGAQPPSLSQAPVLSQAPILSQAAAPVADYVEPDFVPDDAPAYAPAYAQTSDLRGMPLGDLPVEPAIRRPGPARPELPAGAPFLDMAALKRGGLALAGVRSRVTEEYRITVGRILRALRSANRTGPGAANLVMVTSARPGEGKSFSALNLAVSVAQNGLAEVLLVDVDAKPRSLSTLLGLRERAGLLDLVDQPELRAEDLLVRTAVEGFSVMPLGTARAGAADAGVTRALATAIERIRRRFTHHVIILDTAPCLSTSDPSTLAPLVDQVIMVVEAGRTQRAELGASLELIKACPNIILVLNKVRLTHRHSFGSYYYFGYPS
jgi:receptor protein-tyrosine kinase